jgi:hypothetical protein
MDETLARCVIQFSGRPHLVWRGMNSAAQTSHRREKNQDMSSAFRFGLAREFSKASPMRPAATCVELLYRTEPHPLSRPCLRLLPRPSMLPASRIHAFGDAYPPPRKIVIQVE